jgi:DNA-binding transcriptional ArsR family regulator
MAELLVSDTKDVLNPNTRTFEEREKELRELEKKEEEERKREKNSPFGRWTQYNNQHTKEMMWLALKHPKAHAILLFLVDQMDNYNAVICSMQVLQEVLGVSRQTISTAIKVLKENGFIAVLKSGTSNVYAINDSVYWKSWGNKKQYSKFPANVVLSLSEQEKKLQVSFAEIGFQRHKEVILKEE